MPTLNPRPNSNWNATQWVEWLRNDLQFSIKADLRPLVASDGLFGVPRQFFCYVDFLGALREGPTPSTTKWKKQQGIPDLATTAKAEKALKELFGPIDAGYDMHAKVLVRMYRHGLVHAFMPRTLVRKSDGQELFWYSYSGRRRCSIEKVYPSESAHAVTHLRVMPHHQGFPNCFVMPVSINCLVEDLNDAINAFCLHLELGVGTRSLLSNMCRTAAELANPERGMVTVPTALGDDS